jgi:hypothetical protein
MSILAHDGPTSSSRDFPLSEAVDRLVRSRALTRSAQLKQLLIHLRDATESGDDTRLSETAIGVNFFRRSGFSPKMDTIVRSEMVRLRRKLEEYYASEGAADPMQLVIGKNLYQLLLIPHEASPAEVAPAPSLLPSQTGRVRGFWTGAAAGLVAGAVLAAAFLLMAPSRVGLRAEPAAARSPLWQGFASAPVDVRFGSALFFKYSFGYERNWALNRPEDVHKAMGLLKNWPAIPVWDKWAAFDDMSAAVTLDRFLREMHSTASVLSARQQSIGNLAGRHTIILGHPRFAPLLQEVLSDLDFRGPDAKDGKGVSGFINAHPRQGEEDRYYNRTLERPDDQRDSFLLNQVDESGVDYGLITSVHLPGGGDVLSMFGDRTESSAEMARALTTSNFLEDLQRRVFQSASRPYRSAQIVVRIDYIRGKPTGVVYLTHRIRF